MDIQGLPPIILAWDPIILVHTHKDPHPHKLVLFIKIVFLMITAWDLVLKYAPFYCDICRMQQAHVVTPSLLKSCYVMATDVRITPS